MSCCELNELKYSGLSKVSFRSMAITTIDGKRLRSRTINDERLFLKSAESAVDDDGEYGYEISRRRFLRLVIRKVETCSICWSRRAFIYMNCTAKYGS